MTCGCPCDACTNYCEQCPPACAEGHTYTGGCQLIPRRPINTEEATIATVEPTPPPPRPYGCDGCRCWPPDPFTLAPTSQGQWMPNAHCPHHGVTPSRAAGSPGVGTDTSRRNLSTPPDGPECPPGVHSGGCSEDVDHEHGCGPCDQCNQPLSHFDLVDDALTGVEIDARCPERMGDGLCICGGEWIHGTCEEAADACDTHWDTDDTVGPIELSPGEVWCTGGCEWHMTGGSESDRAKAFANHLREEHQQLNTEEKDGGLFAAGRRLARWLRIGSGGGITGSTGPR